MWSIGENVMRGKADWIPTSNSPRRRILVQIGRSYAWTGRKRGNSIEGSIVASYAITMTSTWNVNDYNPTFHDSRSSSNRFAYRGVSTRTETRSFHWQSIIPLLSSLFVIGFDLESSVREMIFWNQERQLVFRLFAFRHSVTVPSTRINMYVVIKHNYYN